MARGSIEHVVLDEDGNIQPLAQVTVLENDGVTSFGQSLYAAASGGSPLGTNVLTADSLGRIVVYADDAQRVKLSVGGALQQSAVWPDPGQIVTLTADQTLTDTTVIGPLFDAGGMVYNVAAYGALGDGSDETAEQDLAIADLLSTRYVDGSEQYGYAGILYLGPGIHRRNKPWAFQDLFGVTVMGAGSNCTKLAATTRGDSWANLPIFDGSGSLNFRVYGLSIIMDQAGQPDCGLFFAQAAAHDPALSGWSFGGSTAWGPNSGNAIECRDVRVEGGFKFSALGMSGVPSSAFYDCDFYQRGNSNNTTESACVILTRDNPMGMHGANSYPIETGVGGSVFMSDVAFYACELHDLVGADISPGANTNTQALLCDETRQIKFRDGNMSSGGNQYVRLTGGPAASAVGIRGLLFDGVTFYPEGAAQPCLYVIHADTMTGVASPKRDIDTLTLVNCDINLVSSNANAAVIHYTEGAILKRVRLDQWIINSGFTGRAVLGTGAGAASVDDSFIDARGFGVIWGSGAQCTRVTYRMATSTVTAAYEVQSGGMLPVGGPISLAGGATVYLGLGTGASATLANVATPVDQAIRVRNLRLATATAPGAAASGKKYTVTLMTGTTVAGMADTAMTFEINEDELTDRNIAANINIPEGSFAAVKVVASATATTTAALTGSISWWDA